MLTRRTSLLLPLLLLAGCGGRRRTDFPPLRYDYLAPLPLNVASIQIEQRYVPPGVPPDVSQLDPVPPVQALRTMAEDRLQGLGNADLAVFVIREASLIRRKDTISGNLAVELDIYNTPTNRVAYAQASVSATYSGDLDDLPARLYDMTKDMMDRMNVEFEYQLRRSLGSWFLSGSVTRAPVASEPLNQTTPSTLPAPTPMSPMR
jgi:hypothetical protein